MASAILELITVLFAVAGVVFILSSREEETKFFEVLVDF
jgi:hypothetical protein